MNLSSRGRIVLILTVVLSLTGYELVPHLLNMLALPSPPPEWTDDVTQWEQQVAAFRELLPKAEPVGYRVQLKKGEELTTRKVQQELMQTRYAVCPTVVNSTDRSLTRRIINSSSQLSYKE